MAPVLMPRYMKHLILCFNYLHPVWILVVQSALKHKSNIIPQLQLSEVENLMQHSFY